MLPRKLDDIDWSRWNPRDVATLVFIVQPRRLLLIRKKRVGGGFLVHDVEVVVNVV